MAPYFGRNGEIRDVEWVVHLATEQHWTNYVIIEGDANLVFEALKREHLFEDWCF